MSEKNCLFRRSDNGEIVEVPFAYMIEHQDAAGFIVLEDGVEARRCASEEIRRDRPAKKKPREQAKHSVNVPMLSDALGFPEAQFQQFEKDRQENLFHGIEFVRDKDVPQFFQVKSNCPAAYARYVKHRGMYDKNPHSGNAIGGREIELARDSVNEMVAERVAKANVSVSERCRDDTFLSKK